MIRDYNDIAVDLLKKARQVSDPNQKLSLIRRAQLAFAKASAMGGGEASAALSLDSAAAAGEVMAKAANPPLRAQNAVKESATPIEHEHGFRHGRPVHHGKA